MKTAQTMKSSDVKNNLKATLQKVHATLEDIYIEQDGKHIATLTLTPPLKGTKPMRIKTVEARTKWSPLLQHVSIIGSRYVFAIRYDEDAPATKIYLVKAKGYENPWSPLWKAHREDALNRAVPDTAEENIQEQLDNLQDDLREEIRRSIETMSEVVAEGFEKLGNKIGVAFAANNRPAGNILATPEQRTAPLKSADDLESYEVD